MNFIIKLFKFKNLTTNMYYDSILVIVDRLIKYLHIISFKETFTTKQLNFIVLDQLIKYHEILKNVTSNKDKFFTFNYKRT